MTCEYVADGDIAYVQGMYFVSEDENPIEIEFQGGLKGEVLTSDVNNITVRVPEGAQPGPLTVTSVYGSGTSALHFRDQRIILDFDTQFPDGGWHHGWHKASGVDSENGINGQYLVMAGEVTEDASTSDDKFCYDAWSYRENTPDVFDSSNLAEYVMKFEVNVLEPWSAAALQIIFSGPGEAWMNWQETSNGGNPSEDFKWSKSYPRALWIPWETTESGCYTTNGWITVTISTTDFKYNCEGTTLGRNGPGHYSG